MRTRSEERPTCERSPRRPEPDELIARVLHGLRGAAQGLGDAEVELLEAERLGDVVVGAEAKAADAIVLGGKRGEEDDREHRELGVGAEQAYERPAVELGHHHVGDEQIGRAGEGALVGILAVDGGLDAVAPLLEHGRDHAQDPGVVVSHEDVQASCRLPRVARSPG